MLAWLQSTASVKPWQRVRATVFIAMLASTTWVSAAANNSQHTNAVDDAEVTAALAVPGMKIPGVALNGGVLQPAQGQVAKPKSPVPSAADLAAQKEARAAQIAAADLGVQALPELNEPVIDTANLLSSNELAQLSTQIRAISDAGRAQIGVIILPSTGIEPIFDYAARAFTTWKLGTEARDNGILIVVASADRKIQILTGYGVEGLLPDILAKRLIEQTIKPYFKQGQYAAGLDAGISQIDQYLKADPETVKASAEAAKQLQQSNNALPSFIPTALFVMVGLLILSPIVKKLLGRTVGTTGLAAIGSGFLAFAGAPIGIVIVFFLLSIVLMIIGLQTILSQIIFNGGGRGGGFGGGGGGYGGGGGSFGGGGASGSW